MPPPKAMIAPNMTARIDLITATCRVAPLEASPAHPSRYSDAATLVKGRLTPMRTIAVELGEAERGAGASERESRPFRITTKLIQELIDQTTGLLDHAPLETRVTWVRDLFKHIDVDGVEQRAVARWKAPTDQEVDRLESVTEWLRRQTHREAGPSSEAPTRAERLPAAPGGRGVSAGQEPRSNPTTRGDTPRLRNPGRYT